jgi:hypothetical protein
MRGTFCYYCYRIQSPMIPVAPAQRTVPPRRVGDPPASLQIADTRISSASHAKLHQSCEKRRWRQGREGRQRQEARAARFAAITLRTGRSRWSYLTSHPLGSSKPLQSGLALRSGRTRWPCRSLCSGSTLGSCDTLRACWSGWTRRPFAARKNQESNEKADEAHSTPYNVSWRLLPWV